MNEADSSGLKSQRGRRRRSLPHYSTTAGRPNVLSTGPDLSAAAVGTKAGRAGEDSGLIDRLVSRVLKWTPAADRFLTGNGSWLPRWKFDPLKSLDDAFRLVDASKPTSYALSYCGGRFFAEIVIKGKVGQATGICKSRVIASALAGALGQESQNGAPCG